MVGLFGEKIENKLSIIHIFSNSNWVQVYPLLLENMKDYKDKIFYIIWQLTLIIKVTKWFLQERKFLPHD